jgi:tetratricopeptide (TPR) repeat protein
MNRKQRRRAAKVGQKPNRPVVKQTKVVLVDGAELLASGREHHQAGRLAEAEACYRRVPAGQPGHADALHLLGIIAQQRGRHDLAIEWINQAIKHNEHSAAYLCSLGISLNQLGKFDEAIIAYRQAIRIKPDFANAYSNLAGVLRSQGKIDEAITAYHHVIKIKPDLAEAFANLGNALSDQGDFDGAVAAYRRAVRLKPSLAEAHFWLANALRTQGKLDEALASYDRALNLRPDNAEVLNARGAILQQLKRFDEALASYDRALAFRSDYVEALNNRGVTLQELKRFDEALASYDRALTLRPDHAHTLYNRGVTLCELKRYDEALASYDRALTLRPDHADTLNNRGITLQRLKRYDEALVSYDHTLAFEPRHMGALNNRGITLQRLKRYDEALVSYDRALALEPRHVDALTNRGITLHWLTRYDEALVSYDRALALEPRHVDALANRGTTLQELDRLDDALASYSRALTVRPDYAEAHFARSIALLLTGNHREGWPEFEWRWEAEHIAQKRPTINARPWRGEELEGRRLLVFAEQGLGDVMQFVRYLPLLAQKRCRLTFLCPAKLARLLRPLTDGIEVISAASPEREFDFQCALMSLPHRFGDDLTSIPNSVPYLRAENDLVAHWRGRIGDHGFKIGIAWQGNPDGQVDQGRSIPLREYLALARASGIRLISLQRCHGLDQLAELPEDATIETLGEDFDGGPDAFVDTAAVMSNLDLVITSDTSIAHLAGALGCRVWVALKYLPHWVWMLRREDSPWYPSMRLFRQSERDNWKGVFSRMERELRLELNGSTAE